MIQDILTPYGYETVHNLISLELAGYLKASIPGIGYTPILTQNLKKPRPVYSKVKRTIGWLQYTLPKIPLSGSRPASIAYLQINALSVSSCFHSRIQRILESDTDFFISNSIYIGYVI
jgi:hypothetical protein